MMRWMGESEWMQHGRSHREFLRRRTASTLFRCHITWHFIYPDLPVEDRSIRELDGVKLHDSKRFNLVGILGCRVKMGELHFTGW